MPVSGLLKAGGHGQQAALVEVSAYDLQPDGQRAFGAAKGARHGDGGQACQAYTQGVDVGQPVGGGVFAVIADLLGNTGRDGPHDDVALIGKSLLKIVDDHAAHALRLQIVRSEEHTSELQSLMRISYA